jgi:hypothetical protein
MKSYYACLDTGYVKYVPQPLQHLAIGEKASRLDGNVTFYTAEDYESLETQGVIKAKLGEKIDKTDGIIFFSLRQFDHATGFDFEFLRWILDSGYEVHFARENLSIPDDQALDTMFPMLYATRYVYRRDETLDFRQAVWNWLSEEESISCV